MTEPKEVVAWLAKEERILVSSMREVVVDEEGRGRLRAVMRGETGMMVWLPVFLFPSTWFPAA